MTSLRIEQGSTVENVSESLIKKLYDTAVEVPLPGAGEEDAAYLSGHIAVEYTYKSYVDYLAGTIGEGSSGVVTTIRQNAGGRFGDLRIDVTRGYWILFEDEAVENVLKTMLHKSGLVSSDLDTITSLTKNSGFRNNTSITSLNDLQYLTYCTVIDEQTFSGASNCVTMKLPPTVRRIENLRDMQKVEGLRIPSTCTGSTNGNLYIRMFDSLNLLVVDGTINELNMDEQNRRYTAPTNIVINGLVNKIVVAGKNNTPWGGTIWVDDVDTYKAKSGFSSYTSNLSPISSMPAALQNAVAQL